MEITTKTAKQVAEAIQADIISNGLTIAEAARMIDRTPQSLYNVLRGENRIGAKMAYALNQAFGYSKAFLTHGIGELRENKTFEDDNSMGLFQNVWGSYFADASLFTERERLLNNTAKALSQAFFFLNKSLPLGMNIELGIDQSPFTLGFRPKSEIEERLAVTICQYSSMICQVADADKIFKSKALEKE